MTIQTNKFKKFFLGLIVGLSLVGSLAFADTQFRLPNQIGHAGQFLQTNGTNPLWAPASGGGGITSLNGLVAANQFLTTGTTGTDFNISDLTDTHTFNLPIASAINTGKLSNTDFAAFTAKVDGSGANTRVAFWTGTSTLSSSANLTFNAGVLSTSSSYQIGGNFFGSENNIRSSVAVGNGAGGNLGASTGQDTAMGYSACAALTNGNAQNSCFGFQAGQGITTGDGNTDIGYSAGKANTVADYQTFIGHSSGISATGTRNTGIGAFSGSLLSTGIDNLFAGYGAASGAISTGSQNVILGSLAGNFSTNSSNDVFVGYSVNDSTTSGGQNVIVGSLATATGFAASNNVLLGYNAQGVSDSIAIGSNSVAGSNSIVFGSGATSSSNQLIVGSDTSTLINSFFGEGELSATPFGSFHLGTTGGLGTDIGSNNLLIDAGISTGAAAPATISFQTTTVGTTGSTPQTLFPRLTIDSEKVRFESGNTGIQYNTTSVTSPGGSYVVLPTDYILSVTADVAGTVIVLPTAATKGDTYIVKDVAGTAGASNITLQGFAGESIDGLASFVLSTNYASVTVYWNGSEWSVI